MIQKQKKQKQTAIQPQFDSENHSSQLNHTHEITKIDSQFLKYIASIQKQAFKRQQTKIKSQYSFYLYNKKCKLLEKKAVNLLEIGLAGIFRKNANQVFTILKEFGERLEQKSDDNEDEDRDLLKIQIEMAVDILEQVYSHISTVQLRQGFQKILKFKRKHDNKNKMSQNKIIHEINLHELLEDQNKMHYHEELRIAKKVFEGELRTVEEKIQKQRKARVEKIKFYQKEKQNLHDQITSEIEKMNMIRDDSLNASEESSFNSYYCQLVGKEKPEPKYRSEKSEARLIQGYVKKSIELQEKIDEIRHVCQRLMGDLGPEMSEIEQGFVQQALSVLQIQPLG